MKKLVTLLVLINLYLIPTALFCQEDEQDSSKAVIDLLVKGNLFSYTKLAFRFLEYDYVAWHSADLMAEDPLALLALKKCKESFCYKKDSIYYAVYGNLKGNSYKVEYQFYLDTLEDKVKKCEKIQFDTARLLPYAIAIKKAFDLSVEDSLQNKLRYDHFVFTDSLNQINVVILPSYQLDYKAVFGTQYWYIFDSKAGNLLKKQNYSANLRYYLLDKNKDIVLNFSDCETMPFCAVYFTLKYKKQFKTITVETKSMRHMFDQMWISIVKQNK